MAEDGEPRDRVPNAQSGALRHGHRRQINHEDQPPERSIILNGLHATAVDVPSAEPDVYDAIVEIIGCDFLTFYLEDPTAGGATNFKIALQFGRTRGAMADHYTDAAGDGILVRKVYTAPIVPSCWTLENPPLRFVRAQVWGTSAGIGSRATLRMVRGMRAQ